MASLGLRVGAISLLILLTTLFPMHPRISLAFLATRTLQAHGQLVTPQDPQVLPYRAPPQQVSPHPCAGMWGCSSSGAGPNTCPCQTPSGFSTPNSPACQDQAEWIPIATLYSTGSWFIFGVMFGHLVMVFCWSGVTVYLVFPTQFQPQFPQHPKNSVPDLQWNTKRARRACLGMFVSGIVETP